jgi:succinate dehydrogenase / fumarate reductase, cytochrome b subunit
VKVTRPVYLNLWRIKFPLPAIISILHRVSGVVIFLGLPILLYLLSQSLVSQDSFDQVSAAVANPFLKLLIWIIMSAFAIHFFAGIRHLLMDIGWGESLPAGRRSARIVAVLVVLTIILLGIWIWS